MKEDREEREKEREYLEDSSTVAGILTF